MTGARLIGVVHAGRRDRRPGEQPRRQRRRGDGYVEAELDRRHPVRLLIRSDDPADLREALRQLPCRLGGDDRAAPREPAGIEHRSVERRVVGGADPAPPGLRPRLVVPALRARLDRAVHADGAGDRLRARPGGAGARPRPPSRASTRCSRCGTRRRPSSRRGWPRSRPSSWQRTAPVPDGEGWPPYARGRSVRQCLGTVLNESFEHHGFCVRDLAILVSTARRASAE